MSDEQECQRLLDEILLERNGEFAPVYAHLRLTNMRKAGDIGDVDYAELLDALNTRKETGSYTGCVIMQRALAAHPDAAHGEERA